MICASYRKEPRHHTTILPDGLVIRPFEIGRPWQGPGEMRGCVRHKPVVGQVGSGQCSSLHIADRCDCMFMYDLL